MSEIKDIVVQGYGKITLLWVQLRGCALYWQR